MKKCNILFVCGSLEEGRDGVGDYLRELSLALHQRGNTVAILAFDDKYISIPQQSNKSNSGQTFLSLRLPRAMRFAKKKIIVHEFLTAFRPDILSLQYVPYGFSAKGLPLNLANQLRQLAGRGPWHFMIHEPYLKNGSSFKEKLVGLAQMFALRRLFQKLRPKLVHTSIHSYRASLAQIGIDSRILGLFGNIPMLNREPASVKQNPKFIRAIYFGAAPKAEFIPKFAEGIHKFLALGFQFELLLCGASGERGIHFAQTLRKSCGPTQFQITELGMLSPEALADLFAHADMGIARIGPALLGKSGSAIALLEHGLPLWIPLAQNREEIEREFDYKTEQCFTHPETWLQGVKRGIPERRIDEIALKFESEIGAVLNSKSGKS